MNRVDKGFSDIEQLEGGKPPSKSEIGLREFVSEVPDSLARLFTTKDGWTLLLYAFVTGIGLSAIDSNVAHALVQHQLADAQGNAHGKLRESHHLNHDSTDHRIRHLDGLMAWYEGGLHNEIMNSVSDAGVVSGLGLSEVDSVHSLTLGNGGVGDQILEKLYQKQVVDANGNQAGIDILNPTVVELSDTSLVDASTMSDHLRTMRGGFDTIDLDTSHIIFGTAPNGQAIVVLAENTDGSLTGFSDGSENGRIFGMQFGSGEAANFLGIFTKMDGVQVFQPLFDPITGRVLIPTGTVDNGIATYNDSLHGGGKSLAMVVAFENYESPAFNALQDMVAQEESGKYTLTSLEDGLLFDGKPTGVDVDNNGVMTITVGDTEVVVDPSILHLGPNGLTIDGYKDVGDDWEPLVPPVLSTETGLATQAQLDDLGVTSDEVVLKMDGDSVVCIEKENGIETGKEVCRDGVFNQSFVEKQATENAKNTGLEPRSGNVPAGTQTDEVVKYEVDLLKRARNENNVNALGYDFGEPGKGQFKSIMLSEENKSWGMLFLKDRKDPSAPKYFIYEKASGELVIVPVK